MPLSIRITPELRDALISRANDRGRSITQEAEILIDHGIRDQEQLTGALARLYGPQLAGLLLLIGTVMRVVGENAGFQTTFTLKGKDGWMDLPYPFDQACQAVDLILTALRPEGLPSVPKSFANGPGVFSLAAAAKVLGRGMARPYLGAVADPSDALSRPLALAAAEIRALLGEESASRVGANLAKLASKEEGEPAE